MLDVAHLPQVLGLVGHDPVTGLAAVIQVLVDLLLAANPLDDERAAGRVAQRVMLPVGTRLESPLSSLRTLWLLESRDGGSNSGSNRSEPRMSQ